MTLKQQGTMTSKQCSNSNKNNGVEMKKEQWCYYNNAISTRNDEVGVAQQ
jgi:hypothetical protein